MFSLERKSKEQEREAKLGERELGELRSSNQYLLERLEQGRMIVEIVRFSCLASITHVTSLRGLSVQTITSLRGEQVRMIGSNF